MSGPKPCRLCRTDTRYSPTSYELIERTAAGVSAGAAFYCGPCKAILDDAIDQIRRREEERTTQLQLAILASVRALPPTPAPATALTPPDAIVAAVCERFGFDPGNLRAPKRYRALNDARHIAMYLLRQDAGLTLAAIAERLGRRDHSTVVHAVKALERQIPNSAELREHLDVIRGTATRERLRSA